jgi:elongator complex protein 4
MRSGCYGINRLTFEGRKGCYILNNERYTQRSRRSLGGQPGQSEIPIVTNGSMPSVFTRRAPSANVPLPKGTIPSPSASALPILSTGIPSLDDVLGSGQPLNSILGVLAPDVHSAWGKLIARYYIAQGLALGQDVLVIGGSEMEDLEELVKGCMWIEESAKRVAVADANAKDPGNPDGDDSDAEGLADDLDGGNRTRIAWRYENMKRFETSVSTRTGSSCE